MHRPEPRGALARCIKYTPPLRTNGTYEIMEVIPDIVLGNLCKVKDTATGKMVDGAYYPWRFQLIK